MGGFFSFIFIVIALIFSFLFGQDFFYRINSKIRSQKVFPDFAKKINLSRNVLTLPWRIENDDGEPFKFDGIIYFEISFDFCKEDEFRNSILIILS